MKTCNGDFFARQLPCGVIELATFLDRKPFIWFWRPTYRVVGPFIRRCKELIFSGVQLDKEYDARLAALETGQRQTALFLEELLTTILSDRQIPREIEEMHAVFTSALSKHAAEIAATNAAQWNAIEQLLLALMGNSDRFQIVKDSRYASNIISPPAADKVV